MSNISKFIGHLINNVDEFKGQTPEQVITAINELVETEEGMKKLEQLTKVSKFQRGGKYEGDHIIRGIKELWWNPDDGEYQSYPYDPDNYPVIEQIKDNIEHNRRKHLYARHQAFKGSDDNLYTLTHYSWYDPDSIIRKNNGKEITNGFLTKTARTLGLSNKFDEAVKAMDKGTLLFTKKDQKGGRLEDFMKPLNSTINHANKVDLLKRQMYGMPEFNVVPTPVNPVKIQKLEDLRKVEDVETKKLQTTLNPEARKKALEYWLKIYK